MTTRIVFDQGALHALLQGEDGAVAKDLARRAIKVDAAAKRLCPVDTGRLRSSIQHVPGEDGQGPYVDVGTNVEYAVPVEYGTAVSPAQPYMRPALLTATKSWVALARGGGPL